MVLGRFGWFWVVPCFSNGAEINKLNVGYHVLYFELS